MPALSALSGMAMWLAISASPSVAAANGAVQARALDNDAVREFVLISNALPSVAERDNLPNPATGVRSYLAKTDLVISDRPEVLGPEWSYQPDLRGPRLEFGAFGGGNENAPFLAHVAIDWQF